MRGGRPNKLTADIQLRIVEAVRGGNRLETAAELAGVGASTVYRWMAQGNNGAGEFREFFHSIKRAHAEAEAEHVSAIRSNAPKNWRAAAWWLARSFPARWGRRRQSK